MIVGTMSAYRPAVGGSPAICAYPMFSGIAIASSVTPAVQLGDEIASGQPRERSLHTGSSGAWGGNGRVHLGTAGPLHTGSPGTSGGPTASLVTVADPPPLRESRRQCRHHRRRHADPGRRGVPELDARDDARVGHGRKQHAHRGLGVHTVDGGCGIRHRRGDVGEARAGTFDAHLDVATPAAVPGVVDERLGEQLRVRHGRAWPPSEPRRGSGFVHEPRRRWRTGPECPPPARRRQGFAANQRRRQVEGEESGIRSRTRRRRPLRGGCPGAVAGRSLHGARRTVTASLGEPLLHRVEALAGAVRLAGCADPVHGGRVERERDDRRGDGVGVDVERERVDVADEVVVLARARRRARRPDPLR